VYLRQTQTKHLMKSIFTFAAVICAMLVSSSCQEKCCGVADTNIAVVVKDKQGNNLLNQTTSGHYDADQIRLFSVNNGVRTEIPSNKFTVSAMHGGSLNFAADASSKPGDLTVTAVVWAQNDEDVIESTLERAHNSTKCSHVKCNGVTKYTKDSGSARVIEIIK